MARDKDEDPDDALPPIGEGTVDLLEQAKKGKPRNFLLICKGPILKYLLVSKKPIKKAQISEAKKLGYKGDAYIGVITGSGTQLVFNLAISDGYDSEPCNDKKLKDFLSEHADFKCQPSFAILSVPPEVPFDEDELSHPLIARFLNLTNLAKEVGQKHPEYQQEIKTSGKEIRFLLQDGDFSTAEQRIDQYESRLNLLLAGGVAQQTSPSPSTVDDALKQKLQDALNKLTPQIKQAIDSYPERKAELLNPIAEIKKQIDAGMLQEAKQGILEAGQLLKSVLAGANNSLEISPTANDVDALRLEYEKKLLDLLPQYEMALKQQLGDVGKFRAVMAYLTEQAEAGVYAKAIKGIEGLVAAIEKAIQAGKKETDVIPENVVQTRKMFLLSRWQEAIKAAYAEIAKIATPISQLVPEENPNELVDGLTRALESFVDELNTAILSTQDASGKNLQPLDEAKQAITRFRQQLSGDALIELFDSAKAKLGVDVQIRSNLIQAIDEIDARLST